MTHRLATNYAKNYCNRTLIVKVIVENVVTCFLGHSVSETRRDSKAMRLLLRTNRKSHIRAYDWCQNKLPWMTLKGHYALCFKTRASFGAHSENLNEDTIQ